MQLYWVLVRGFNLSYHNKDTILFTVDPHYGNLNKILNRNPVWLSRLRVTASFQLLLGPGFRGLGVLGFLGLGV